MITEIREIRIKRFEFAVTNVCIYLYGALSIHNFFPEIKCSWRSNYPFVTVKPKKTIYNYHDNVTASCIPGYNGSYKNVQYKQFLVGIKSELLS